MDEAKSSEPIRLDPEQEKAPDETLKRAMECHELGILFVHGIGTQRDGDVVLQCGEALHDWLERWAGGRPPGAPASEPRFLEARLTGRGAEAPAHARLMLGSGTATERDGDNESRATSWLLAESHWAESFRAPTFTELLTWALATLPRAVLLHSLNPSRSLRETLELRFRGDRQGLVATDAVDHASNVELVMKTLGGAAWLFVSPVVIFVTLMSLVVVFVLRLIPLAATRSLAGTVQRLLAATLGDSFLFSTSAVTEAAVVTRVEEDLAWLAARCRKVAIVAHSQGAAVSYRLLQRLRLERKLPGNLVQLVTYGSGLRKLTDLVQAEWPLARLTLVGWLATGLAVALGLLIIRLAVNPSILLAFLLMIPPVLMTVLVTAGSVLIERPKPEPPLPVHWLDLYASRDPVPNGPVDVRFWRDAAAGDIPVQRVGDDSFSRRSVRVYNRHSILGDHTSYWSDGAGDFIARLLVALAPLAGTSLISDADTERFERFARIGRRRAGQLAGLRIGVPLVVLSILTWQRDALTGFGESAAGWLASVTAALPELLAGPLEPGLGWLANRPVLLGTLGLALALAIVYKIGLLGWIGQRRHDHERLFRGDETAGVSLGFWLFCAGWVGLIATPLAFASRFASGEPSMWPLAVWGVWAALRLAPGPRVFEVAVGERGSQP